MNDHTYGPWQLDEDGDIESSCHTLIAITMKHGFTTDEEPKANAKLIASAPELLDAARAALKEMSCTAAPRPSFTAAIDALSEVIAKATSAQ